MRLMKIAIVEPNYTAALSGKESIDTFSLMSTRTYTLGDTEKWSTIIPECAATDAMHEAVSRYDGKSIRITITPVGEIDDKYIAKEYRGLK